MRYLSIVFASLLLVGCAQSTDVEPATQDVDTQSQQESTQPEDSEQPEETQQTESEELTEDESKEEEVSEETEAAESGSNESDTDEPQTSEPSSGENQSDETDSAEPVEEVMEEEAPEEVEEPEVEPSGFTMAMVSENDDASSCWSAINGNVYDLTDWIDKHRGGPSRILGLCGSDGSASFNAMHSGQSNPESRLQSFLLGPLS